MDIKNETPETSQKSLDLHAFVELFTTIAYVVEAPGDEIHLIAANSPALATLPKAMAELDAKSLAQFWNDGSIVETADALRRAAHSRAVVSYAGSLSPGIGIAIPLQEPSASGQRVLCVELSVGESLTRALLMAHPRLAGLIHDARNLVLPVMGWAELIATAQPRLEQARRNISDSAAMLASLLGTVMEILTSGTENADKAEPEVVIEGLRELLQGLVGERIVLAVDKRAGPVTVNLSTDSLKQVLLNLVINARDAMPDGGRIDISTRLRAQPNTNSSQGDDLLISVADTGQGMDPDTLAHALDPLFSTHGPPQQRGIGLWAVADLVRQAGGEISVLSTLGTGSTIELVLPVSE